MPMKKIAKIHNKGQFDPKTLELDPILLQTSFKIQTNWVVITGSACTGKTTMTNMLADRGFSIIPETAREYIDQEITNGRGIEEIIINPQTQLEIIKMQRRAESGDTVEINELAFLDRGLPDSLTFYRYNGLDPNSILLECFHKRYALVFILDRLPLQLDGARIPDESFLNYLDTWLEKDYVALGYQVIRVPVINPEARLEFILDILSKHRLI
jgi:predicted ATPase